MLEPIETRFIQCPYCWENFEIVIDTSESEQHYVEDCYVCCRPIHLHVHEDAGELTVIPQTEDESTF